MPPKEDMNVMDGTLYFEDENGELKPITVIRNIELTTDIDLEDIIPEEYRLPTECNFNCSLGYISRDAIKCYLMPVNNYRRLHGLRPIRNKVQRHKPERGGFKFK